MHKESSAIRTSLVLLIIKVTGQCTYSYNLVTHSYNLNIINMFKHLPRRNQCGSNACSSMHKKWSAISTNLVVLIVQVISQCTNS